MTLARTQGPHKFASSLLRLIKLSTGPSYNTSALPASFHTTSSIIACRSERTLLRPLARMLGSATRCSALNHTRTAAQRSLPHHLGRRPLAAATATSSPGSNRRLGTSTIMAAVAYPPAGAPGDDDGSQARLGKQGPGAAGVRPEDAPDEPLRFRGTQPVRGRSASPRTGRGPAFPGLASTCWGQEQSRQEYPQLGEDITADVAIVGGGISGLTTAYLLAKAGKRVVVLESRVLGAGQTGRAVGEMTPWHTGLFSSLERWTNQEQRRQVALSNSEAINFVESVVKSEGIDCGFARLPTFLLPSAAEPVPGDSRDPRSSSSQGNGSSSDASREPRQADRLLRQELEACRAAGLEVDMVNLDSKMGGGVALQLPGGASLNPLAYIRGLADAITNKYGGRIYEGTRVRRHDYRKKTLTTMEGHTVTASQAYVLATASPITTSLVDSALHVLALHGKQHVRRRYVVGLKIPKFSGFKPGLYYDTGEPQHTAMITPGKQSSQHGYHDLLLVAGEAHDQGKRPSQYGNPVQQLERWAKTRWPAAGETIFTWSYQYYQTAEDLGLYGVDPTATNVKSKAFVATGDCGRIMTGGTIAGNVIASELLGWPSGQLFKGLYNPSRKLRGLNGLSPRYFKNTIESAVDMLLPLPRYLASTRDIESLPAGEGQIINSGLRKVAIYKDEDGDIHRFSGLCPHLGCLLQWNPADKEWNCACHGSCFDKQGANIAGPATIDMTRLKK